MSVVVGGWWKNGTYIVQYLWPIQTQSFNDVMDRKVSMWCSKNERSMARSRPHQVVQMVLEEFPEIVEVEVRSHPGGYGQVARGRRE